MSPAKKPPRPVTRWIILWDDGDLGSSVWPHKPGKDYIRCRVTPIRAATDAEIERLAAQFCAVGFDRHIDCVKPETKKALLIVARAAFKKGARP